MPERHCYFEYGDSLGRRVVDGEYPHSLITVEWPGTGSLVEWLKEDYVNGYITLEQFEDALPMALRREDRVA